MAEIPGAFISHGASGAAADSDPDPKKTRLVSVSQSDLFFLLATGHKD
jgi:hypothetical protein